MNKKANTVIFLIAATIFNLFLMLVFIILFIIIPPIVLGEDMYQRVSFYLAPLMIIAGIVIAFFVYNRIMKFLQKKFDFEKYLEPLFKKKR